VSTHPTPDEIRAAREAAGLSQHDAAALIDCTRDAWAKYENGTRNIDRIKWHAWRVMVGFDPPEFILWLGEWKMAEIKGTLKEAKVAVPRAKFLDKR